MASKSGVHTDVGAKVTHTVWTQTHNFIVTSTTSFLFDYAQARGLGVGHITDIREKLESALYTYISSRHMRKASIEVYEKGASKNDPALERFDLTFEIKDPDDLSPAERDRLEERDFNTYRKDVMEQIQQMDSLPEEVDYRLLLWTKPENDIGQSPPPVDGWSSTSARSTDDLQYEDLGDAADTGYITAKAGVWVRS